MVKALQNADLILTNADVITLDPFGPKASWVRIKEDSVIDRGQTVTILMRENYWIGRKGPPKDGAMMLLEADDQCYRPR